MEVLNRPQPGEFVFCRIPLSNSRTNAPAEVWHSALVLGVTEDYEGEVTVHVVGTTSNVSRGNRLHVTVRADSNEGRTAGAKNDFDICCEWQKELPLTEEYFGKDLSVKGALHARLRQPLGDAVRELAKRYK